MTADATLPASDDLIPEVLARWEEREKTALHRVWTAMGCAPNPDDFKPAVRDQMWDMVVDSAEKDAAKNNRLYRENAELLSGVRSRDARIVELEAEVAARDAGIAGAVAQLRYGSASQAERILSAAPSSELAARDAEKWDEGRQSVGLDFARRPNPDGTRTATPNPYRAGADPL